MFYGQSITAQGWWRKVVDQLKAQFPEADIEAANPAIEARVTTTYGLSLKNEPRTGAAGAVEVALPAWENRRSSLPRIA